MKINGLSTNGLKLLQDTIRGALEEDDALPPGSKKYGVREYPDWRAQSDQIEAELTKRLDAHSGDLERLIRSIMNTDSGDHEHPLALA